MAIVKFETKEIKVYLSNFDGLIKQLAGLIYMKIMKILNFTNSRL